MTSSSHAQRHSQHLDFPTQAVCSAPSASPVGGVQRPPLAEGQPSPSNPTPTPHNADPVQADTIPDCSRLSQDTLAPASSQPPKHLHRPKWTIHLPQSWSLSAFIHNSSWNALAVAFFTLFISFGAAILVYVELRTIPSQDDVMRRGQLALRNLNFAFNNEILGLLRNTEALVQAAPFLDARKFQTFIELSEPNPSLWYSLALYQRITHDQIPAWESFHNATVMDIDSSAAKIPAANRSEYWPLIFYASTPQDIQERSARSNLILGIDPLSEPIRNQVIQLSMQDGQPHMTPSLRFIVGSIGFAIFQVMKRSTVTLPNGLSSGLMASIGFDVSVLFTLFDKGSAFGYQVLQGQDVIYETIRGDEVFPLMQTISFQLLDQNLRIQLYPVPKYPLTTYNIVSRILLAAILLFAFPAAFATHALVTRLEQASEVSYKLQTSSKMLDSLKARSSACVQAIPCPMILLDSQGRIISYNSHAEPLFASDQTNSINVHTIILDSTPPPSDRPRIFAAGSRQVLIRRPDGSTFPADLSVSDFVHSEPLAQVILFTDASEKCAMLTRLERAQADIARANAARSTMLLLLCHELQSPSRLILDTIQEIIFNFLQPSFDEATTEASTHATETLHSELQMMLVASRHIYSLIEDALILIGEHVDEEQQYTRSSIEPQTSSPLSSQPTANRPPHITATMSDPSDVDLVCLWLTDLIAAGKYMFNLKKMTATFSVVAADPNHANIYPIGIQAPRSLRLVLSKLVDQGYAMAETNSACLISVIAPAHHPKGTPAQLEIRLFLTKAAYLPSSIHTSSHDDEAIPADNDSDNPSMPMHASASTSFRHPLLADSDLFSIRNGGRGENFYSGFTWPVLCRLVLGFNGSIVIREASPEDTATLNLSSHSTLNGLATPSSEENTSASHSNILICVTLTVPNVTIVAPRHAPKEKTTHLSKPNTPFPLCDSFSNSPPRLNKRRNRDFLGDRPQAELPPTLSNPIHVLVAEDNMMVQKITCKLITTLGHQVSAVNNGRLAVDFMLGSAQHLDDQVSSGPIDLIFMDLIMPEMDGYEAAKIIHDHFPNVPIIALTANATNEERQRCIDSGVFSDFATKPFKRPLLCELLQKWVPMSSTGNLDVETNAATRQ